MKNLLIIILALSFSSVAMATSDSVAFYYSSEKIVVQINERGSYGRIHQLMDHLDAGSELLILSDDETIKLGCMRSYKAASCTFRFLPGRDVVIENRSLALVTDLENLGLGHLEDFTMSFASSMKDRLNLEIKKGKMFITGSKILK